MENCGSFIFGSFPFPSQTATLLGLLPSPHVSRSSCSLCSWQIKARAFAFRSLKFLSAFHPLPGSATAQSGVPRSRDTDAQKLRSDPQSRMRQRRRCITHPALPGAHSADSGSPPVFSTLLWQLKPSLLHCP
ncbi:hypothetical protein T07_1283 [Trichinella nelsoni]|uniref:Uncharacterized protein n=1 Tax=Trichinella nelsoni TaxID=6336 RepID=A0A0V0S658_9BILA|nr:hypothetical protein T07_1283 [Trichinella nelsoni]